MLHLVYNPYDPRVDYEDLCKRLFGENKCLVMLEATPKDHCHIQGELKEEMSEFAIRNLVEKLSKEHYMLVLARPLRGRCRRRSVPDVPPSMRCLCQNLVSRTSEPVCMHCTPTSCPNAADAGRLERDHAPQSTEPSFPGALTATGAARAARGSGQILLQADGTIGVCSKVNLGNLDRGKKNNKDQSMN